MLKLPQPVSDIHFHIFKICRSRKLNFLTNQIIPQYEEVTDFFCFYYFLVWHPGTNNTALANESFHITRWSDNCLWL